MKLYDLTVTARVDDLGTLDVSLSAELTLPDTHLRGTVMSILPAHLRKVAADLEAEAGGTPAQPAENGR